MIENKGEMEGFAYEKLDLWIYFLDKIEN